MRACMRTIKDTLHEKRSVTEAHIRQLQREQRQGVRYTAMMPDVPFLILGLLSDIGWLTQLTAGIVYSFRNSFHYVLDYIALFPLAGVLCGISYLVFLNKIHEKEIATRRQKNLSFGMTAFSGLAGAVLGSLQIVISGASPALVWLVIGGLLNFAAGLPIFLSFKKGIFYGVT